MPLRFYIIDDTGGDGDSEEHHLTGNRMLQSDTEGSESQKLRISPSEGKQWGGCIKVLLGVKVANWFFLRTETKIYS